jgi:predicted ATPase
MSLFEQFATNRKAEVEGIEVTFDNVTFFRIARMSKNNKRYQKMLEAETKPHRQALLNDTMDAKLAEAIDHKVFISTVLLGWRGLKEPKIFQTDEEVPFSAENATKLFDALPELYTELQKQASKLSNFRAAEVEDDSKN